MVEAGVNKHVSVGGKEGGQKQMDWDGRDLLRIRGQEDEGGHVGSIMALGGGKKGKVTVIWRPRCHRSRGEPGEEIL